MQIDTKGLGFAELNEIVRNSGEQTIELYNVCGQRYIASGLSGKEIKITGTPGNALGAYLNGCNIKVFGNAQDATGDTLNSGSIFIEGSAGDACGYAMRGGKIYVKENVGYRAGIHMKEYKDMKPVIVIGGKTGDFLGEYQAGGIIVVLAIKSDGPSVGSYCGTGMHGGKIFVRKTRPKNLPPQVSVSKAEKKELEAISPYIAEFCSVFGYDSGKLLSDDYYVLSPNTKNPYHRLYTQN
ncbi:MAG: glutamate synthase [Bacillota bacterium]|nr:glutamate synthase [Bacillota bacterium]